MATISPPTSLAMTNFSASTPDRTHVHIIVNEETAKIYAGKDSFGKVFCKARKSAGIERNLTFQDLRTTALTIIGDSGATTAKIVAFSGHKFNSPVFETYVKPGREAAIRGRLKRYNSDLSKRDKGDKKI